MNQKTIGISLSGGAIRAVAHLGFLNRMMEEGLKPSKICGVSGGAIVAAFICDGYTPKETFDLFKEYQILKLFSPTWSAGLMSMSKLRTAIKENIRSTNFEDFQIPLCIYTSNLMSEKLQTFHTGEIMNPLIASCSIPVLFKPVMIHGETHVDGGVLDNLPFKDIAECDVKIGINVNPRIGEKPISNMMDVAWRVFKMVTYRHSTLHKSKFDFYVCPQELKPFRLFDVKKMEAIYQIGEQSADSLLSDIKNLYSSSK